MTFQQVTFMNLRYTIALSLPLLGAPALATDLAVKLTLPQLNVAEYHKPYVALWLERPDQSFVGNFAVLYDLKKKDHGGEKWLKDMRTWWRKSGRELDMPVDGVSGATRAAGEHVLNFAGNKSPLLNLAPGEYHMVVEAAREAGGREVLRIPFNWPAAKAQTVAAAGKHELGALSLQFKP